MESTEVPAAETGPPPAGGSPEEPASWTELVAEIQSGDASAMEEFYRRLSKGIRFYLCRQLGPQDLDDRVHDTFLIAVQAIRRGELREPERLMGFVRTVVRRQVAAYIDTVVHNRKEQVDLESGVSVTDSRGDPESVAIGRQQEEIMTKVLRSISGRDREILTRFYLKEQTQQQICVDMNLTETQFRLLKSRAKARFGELGKRQLVRKNRSLADLT